VAILFEHHEAAPRDLGGGRELLDAHATSLPLLSEITPRRRRFFARRFRLVRRLVSTFGGRHHPQATRLDLHRGEFVTSGPVWARRTVPRLRRTFAFRWGVLGRRGSSRTEQLPAVRGEAAARCQGDALRQRGGGLLLLPEATMRDADDPMGVLDRAAWTLGDDPGVLERLFRQPPVEVDLGEPVVADAEVGVEQDRLPEL